jgi:cell division protein FtsW (lipid II flippase)
MASGADDRSRALGAGVVLLAVVAGFLFLAGLASRSYLALAVPVAAGVLFVLGLVIWIGWTIATVQTPASGESLPLEGNPSAPTASLGSDEASNSQSR